MGKTPLPLRILAHPTWVSHPAMVILAGQGHTVTPWDEPCDLLLHPMAHRWGERFWDEKAYLAAALKQARSAKRGGK